MAEHYVECILAPEEDHDIGLPRVVVSGVEHLRGAMLAGVREAHDVCNRYLGFLTELDEADLVGVERQGLSAEATLEREVFRYGGFFR